MKDLFDLSAEKMVIGSAMMGHIAPLEAADFYVGANKRIWEAVLSLQFEGDPVTNTTIVARLGDDAVYSYLTECVLDGSVVTAEYMADRVADLSARRRVIAAMQEGAKGIYDLDRDLGDTIGRTYLRMGSSGSGLMRTHRLDVDSVVNSFLDAKVRKSETWGMRSGIGAIDTELGGIHKRTTFAIAGEPGVGKSILSQQLALQLAGLRFWNLQNVDDEGHPGAVFQLEMTETQTVERAACGLARIELKSMKQGRLTEDEEASYMRALERIRDAPVYWSDSTHWTSMNLALEVGRLASEQGIEWVLIDYAGKLRDEHENEVARERIISQALTNMANDNDVAVIFVETLNKAGFKKTEAGRRRRGVEAVSGSVLKMYNAHVAAFLEIPAEAGERTEERRLRFTKVREGDPFMQIPLRLDGPQKRIEPLYK